MSVNLNLDSRNTKDAAKRLTPVIGTGSTLYFKEGNYRHDYSGGIFEFDIYNKEENKIYQKKRNNDTIFWTDCGKAADKIVHSFFTSKADTVLGIICDRFKIQYSKSSEIHYYNNDSIRINPDWFKKFRLSDEYLIDLKEKSIYLKSENTFDYFTLIETATQINRRKVDIEKFSIPKNAILAEQN